MAVTNGNTGMTMCGGTNTGINAGNNGRAEADAIGRALCTAVAIKGESDEGGVELIEERI